MLKPFAVSRREQFTLTLLILSVKSKDQDERRKRKDVWTEFNVTALKKAMTKVRRPEEGAAPAGVPQPWDWDGEEPEIRVELHQNTINYVIEMTKGELPSFDGETLGDLHERLISLRDTPDATLICTSIGSGYHLPVELWTDAELKANAERNAPRTLPPADAAPPAALHHNDPRS